MNTENTRALLDSMATVPIAEAKADDTVMWHCPRGQHADFASTRRKVRRNIARSGHGCPTCSRSLRYAAKTGTLADTAPVVAGMLVDGDPHFVTAGSSQVHNWRCQNDPEHTFEATVVSVVRSVVRRPTRTKGCPHCKASTSGDLPTGVRRIGNGKFQARRWAAEGEVTKVFPTVEDAVKWRQSAA